MEKQNTPQNNPTQKHTLSKRERLLMAFLATGYQGLRGMECADREGIRLLLLNQKVRFWSSCLHSDVSLIQGDINITIARKTAPYNSPAGHIANFKLYWLSSYQDAGKALTELNRMRQKRSEKPFDELESELILSVFL